MIDARKPEVKAALDTLTKEFDGYVSDKQFGVLFARDGDRRDNLTIFIANGPIVDDFMAHLRYVERQVGASRPKRTRRHAKGNPATDAELEELRRMAELPPEGTK